MPHNYPILLVEDDENDADVVLAAIQELGIQNKVVHFKTAQEGYNYLMGTDDKPFLILSDIRMPKQDGLVLLKSIQADPYLRSKAVPFVFLTGLVSQNIIDEAFNIGVQGFYVKPHEYIKLRDMIRIIITYWLYGKHPSARYSEKEASKSDETIGM